MDLDTLIPPWSSLPVVPFTYIRLLDIVSYVTEALLIFFSLFLCFILDLSIVLFSSSVIFSSAVSNQLLLSYSECFILDIVFFIL